jgi:AcrR family transcriptional regulator
MAERSKAVRMPRAQRREQILAAATRAFARGGFAAVGIEDVAEEAGVTRVILYSHFDSKSDLYRAVLARACARLRETVGEDDFDDTSIATLVQVAAADPDGFRLLFRYAPKEPEFSDVLGTGSVDIAHRNLTTKHEDGPWTRWAAQLLPTLTIEAVIAWLDLGQPDPDQAADRIGAAVHGVIAAAGPR